MRDTPGYGDFFGEVISALRVAESLLVLVNAVAGVEVQTEIAWEEADKRQIPRLIFVNKMDRENASFSKALASIKENLKGNMVPVQIPIGEAEGFKGIIDILEGKAYLLEGDREVEAPVPEEFSEEVASLKEGLVEAATEGDDELLMKYLDGEELDLQEIAEGFKKAVMGVRSYLSSAAQP